MAKSALIAFMLALTLPQSVLATKKYPGLEVPFTEEVVSSPALWFGHDFDRIQRGVKALPKKDQFESEAEYRERLTPLLLKPLYGQISLADALAFSFMVMPDFGARNQFTYTYDAESERLDVSWSGDQFYANGKMWDYVLRDFNDKTIGSFVGSNAFGVKKNITRKLRVGARVQFPENSVNIKAVQLTRAEAKKALIAPRGILIGHVVAPFYGTDQVQRSASISNPVEWVEQYQDVFFVPDEFILLSSNPEVGIIFRQQLRAHSSQTPN